MCSLEHYSIRERVHQVGQINSCASGGYARGEKHKHYDCGASSANYEVSAVNRSTPVVKVWLDSRAGPPDRGNACYCSHRQMTSIRPMALRILALAKPLVDSPER